MIDTGMKAPYLASSLVHLFKPENKSQFKLTRDLISTKMNDFNINQSIPVTLNSNMLTCRVINKSFKLDGDLLKTMTNFKFKAGHSNQQDQKIIREFAEEMKFDIEKTGRKSPKDSSTVELLKSPAIMASGNSTKFLSSDPNELCDRIKLLLQEKRAGNNSKVINEEIVN